MLFAHRESPAGGGSPRNFVALLVRLPRDPKHLPPGDGAAADSTGHADKSVDGSATARPATPAPGDEAKLADVLAARGARCG